MRKKKAGHLVLGLLLFLGCVGSNTTAAQTLELKNVTRQGFEGLKPLDKNGYYLQFIEGAKGSGKTAKQLLHLYILDNPLKIASDFVLELSPNETVDDVAFNGGNFMVIYSNPLARTRTMKVVDKQGKEIATKKIEKLPYRTAGRSSAIEPVGAADFLVINYVKDKKFGYSVERFDEKLESKYSQLQIPEKKKIYPVDYTLSGNRLYVLEYVDADASDYFEYHLAAFDLATGSLLKSQDLKSADGKAFGFATFVKPAPNGGAVTGGMYFDSPKVQKANSDGFFAAQMKPDGTLDFSYTNWDQVKNVVKDKSTAAMWGGKTKTFMHDLVVKPDGSYTLIGENYRRGDSDLAGEQSKNGLAIASKALKVTDLSGGGEPSEEAVTVAEFVLIDYDAQNKFTGVRKIDKPNAVTVVKLTQEQGNLSYIGQRKGLNLANILNNYGYFPYRFTAQGTSRPYLTYWQRYDPLKKELLYFTPLDAQQTDTVSVDVSSADLQQFQALESSITGKLGALGKLAKKVEEVKGDDHKNYFELKGSHDPYDYRAKDLNSRVMASNVAGKILIYDFVPEPGSEKKSFFAQLTDTTPGTLKVWYIDIPGK
ncbi:DUF6770 family protein [Rufibacter quisquiliarum]|uniref:S9 family peptidase n=1 Tax=Rufibacter quisquiliarum TaxID=1549639 RepID=A0A839GL57_9BACT|nr:DUF6770 family protein [Rufibacter quisquiliarum]MBA9075726.1 hypothetical protein [Rufibacter quisquiliarum]